MNKIRYAAVGVCTIVLGLGIHTPAAAMTQIEDKVQTFRFAQLQSSIDNEQSDIVEYAKQFVGNPYSYGGNSLTAGIDCSHFVWQVLKNTGHYDGTYTPSDGWASLGEPVESLDYAEAGDIIVYPGHVAIYDGQGKLVQALGDAYGITDYRQASQNNIIAIRRFN